MTEQDKIKPGEDIIFYDGVCGLCNKLVQFVLAHGGDLKFLFCSLQSDLAARLLAKYGANSTELKTIFVITDYDLPSSKLLKKSQAVLFILQRCNMPWYTAGLSILHFIPEFFLNIAYDLVANIRYEVFGRYESCLNPGKEVRDRFIDQ